MVNYDFLSVYFYSVPNLRFPIFHFDWNENYFGNICTIRSGIGFKADEYVEQGVPLLKIDNVGYGNIKWNNISYLPETYLKQYPFLKLNENDIVLALNRPITNNQLKISKLTSKDIPSILYQRVGKINVSSDYNLDYIYYLLTKNVFDFVLKTSIGSDQPFISTENLKKLIMKVPTITEQQKIGHFLSLIDQRIQTQIKIINDYKILKNHIIKSFIKQNGTSYLLLEIAELGRGRVINSAEISKQKNPIYPVYSSQTSNNGIMGYLDNYDYEGEYITWTTDGANAGTVYYRNGKFNCTNVCGILKIKNGYDAYYISNILNCYTKKYVSTNLANPKLMNNVMANIKINLPSIEQQKHSSKILQSIEYRVEIEEDIKLNLVKQKAFLLKNMFI